MAKRLDRTWIVTTVLFLLITISLAGYAIYIFKTYSLPISSAFLVFTTLLPILSAIILGAPQSLLTLPSLTPSTFHSTSSNPNSRRLSFPQSSSSASSSSPQLSLILLTIYDTVLATLAGTLLGPESTVACTLDQRWTHLFRTKNAHAIRQIQDAFQCCGLRSAVDRPWPFPAKGVDVHECAARLGNENGGTGSGAGMVKSCFEAWMREERAVGKVVIVLVAVVGLYQIYSSQRQNRRARSWLPRHVGRLVTNGDGFGSEGGERERVDEERLVQQGPSNYRSIEDSSPTVAGRESRDAENPRSSDS